MGDPKFPRKKYETPSHPWEGERIERERELVRKYGLKNKREIWKAETFLRKIRGHARELFVGTGRKQTEKEKEELLKRMITLGLLPPDSQLDDILALAIEDILSRRLQTQVSYMVKKSEESSIQYVPSSPFSDEMHPMRPKAEQRTEIKPEVKEMEVKEGA